MMIKHIKKWFARHKWHFAGLLLIVVVVVAPIMVNVAFRTPAPFEFMVAGYSAGDFLSYIAGSLAFIGTMFLGFVSYKQNRTLQKREDASFIATNACMALVKEIRLNMDKTQAQELLGYEKCVHPIVKEYFHFYEKEEDFFSCSVKLETLHNVPVIVRVESMVICVVNEVDGKATIHDRIDECYSRLSIHKDYVQFVATVVTKPEKKKKYVEIIQAKDSYLTIHISFSLVTDKGVSTHLSCEAMLKSKINEDNRVTYETIENGTMCTWYGNEIVNSNSIRFRR